MSEERRIVTVLFADVAGSTEIGESLDPEDVRVLLARYYTIARDVLSAHGGTVEKFIRDAVMRAGRKGRPAVPRGDPSSGV